MQIEDFVKKQTILDLSFFNFSNAVTAAYFASEDLTILRANKNFATFFPILANVENVSFLDILDQLGVPKIQIEEFKTRLKEKGQVIIPKVEITIEETTKIYSLLSKVTKNSDFQYLNGVQGQFIDRTLESKLKEEKELLLNQKLRDQEIIEEKSARLESIATRLAKYLSPQVYKSIFDSETIDKESHNRRNLTVFFSDIASFTDLSDTLEPEKLAKIINNYLSEMTTIAIECGGTIDKFIGDAVMVFFGDPESLGEEQDALNCIEMALQMQKRIKELRAYYERLGVPGGLDVRMGISTGFCTVGNFGSDQRLDYTALGSPVNLAARLQGLSPKNEILIEEATLQLVKSNVKTDYFNKITPKGFSRPIEVHQVDDFISVQHKKNRQQFSHRGSHVDINVFDTSDINAAIEELKKVKIEFEARLKKRN
ncbi:MAG: adenylate/guanylate cyclase domain-containing protein [Paracoccaceae bacterium]|nr:adenylate/guanylate cyclase domain-containing protein [Paracoccaceae bacterium]